MSTSSRVIIIYVRKMKKYKIGDIVDGKITGIQNYGIFVNINNEYNGLIHISQVSNSFVKNINDYVKVNDVIKVKIINIDDKNKRLKLSIKDLNYKNDSIKFEDSNKNGFKSLQKQLNPWIKEKLAEINKD